MKTLNTSLVWLQILPLPVIGSLALISKLIGLSEPQSPQCQVEIAFTGRVKCAGQFRWNRCTHRECCGQQVSHGSHTAIVDFVQGAKESPGWMAGGARMASQGRLGLRDTEVTREKPAALEHQVKSFSFSSFF